MKILFLNNPDSNFTYCWRPGFRRLIMSDQPYAFPEIQESENLAQQAYPTQLQTHQTFLCLIVRHS